MQPMTTKISALIYFVLFALAPVMSLWVGPFTLMIIPALLLAMWHNEEQGAIFWMEEVDSDAIQKQEDLFEKTPKYIGLTEEVIRMLTPRDAGDIAYLFNEKMVVECCQSIYSTAKFRIGQDAAWAAADQVWETWEAAKAAGKIVQLYVQAGQMVVRPVKPWALAH